MIGGLFLFAMIPLFGHGRWAADPPACRVGFGIGWTILVGLQVGRGGTGGNDPVWVAVGVVPLVIGLAVALTLIFESAAGLRRSHAAADALR